MFANPSFRCLRPARFVVLLLLPLSAAPAGAQSPPAAPPLANQADQELTKLRAEVASLRQQLALKEQVLAKASADLGTARAEQAGNKAVLTQAQAELARARKALTDAAAAREILRRELAVELTTHKVEVAKAREDAAAARLALAETIKARDAALRDLAAVIDRASTAEKKCRAEEIVLSSTREKLALMEAEFALARRELEKSRLHLSDVSFPCPQNGKARFVIEVSAPDVELYVDGKKLDVIEGKLVREFTSTTLETGKRYTLSLRAKMIRDGKVLSTTRQIVFKPDNEYRVYLDPRATPSSEE